MRLIFDKINKGNRFYSPHNVEEKKSSHYQRKHHKQRSRSFVLLKTSMFFKVKPTAQPMKTPIKVIKVEDVRFPMIKNKKIFEEKKMGDPTGQLQPLQITPKSIFVKARQMGGKKSQLNNHESLLKR